MFAEEILRAAGSQFDRANLPLERPKTNGRNKLAMAFHSGLTPGMVQASLPPPSKPSNCKNPYRAGVQRRIQWRQMNFDPSNSFGRIGYTVSCLGNPYTPRQLS
jgi:hypothetical protein